MRLAQWTLRARIAAPRRRTAPQCAGRLNYKSAGVDIDAGAELVRRIQKLSPQIGGFSGRIPFGDSYLVAGTDGVGTKLKIAFEMRKHDTIGIDLVAMSVNDILTSGAKPMFFLDYYATGRLDVDVAEEVVKGIVEGCRRAGCVLLGGETAEMPGFYGEGEYDVAGFAVGSVKKEDFIDGRASVAEGDVLIGLKSSGIHSNGFSLVRKILQLTGRSLKDKAPWETDRTIGELLLEPTVIYVSQIEAISHHVNIKGMVHVTGGGFPENLPRMCPPKLTCRIHRSSWAIPPLFVWLQESGEVETAEMFKTFNMGIGMVIAVPEEDVPKIRSHWPDAVVLGEIVQGNDVTFV